jgi:hypothetical protein
MSISFIDGGNRNTPRKPSTCHNKAQTDYLINMAYIIGKGR